MPDEDNSLPLSATATGPRRGNELRLARMVFDPRMFLYMCQGSFELIHPPLPHDLEILGVHPDGKDKMALVLRSMSFDVVERPEGGLWFKDMGQMVEPIQIVPLSAGNSKMPPVEWPVSRAMLSFNPAILVCSMKSGLYQVEDNELPLDARLNVTPGSGGVGVSASAVHFDMLSRGFPEGRKILNAPKLKLVVEYKRQYRREREKEKANGTGRADTL